MKRLLATAQAGGASEDPVLHLMMAQTCLGLGTSLLFILYDIMLYHILFAFYFKLFSRSSSFPFSYFNFFLFFFFFYFSQENLRNVPRKLRKLSSGTVQQILLPILYHPIPYYPDRNISITHSVFSFQRSTLLPHHRISPSFFPLSISFSCNFFFYS